MIKKSVSKRLNDLDGKSWVKATKSWFKILTRKRSTSQIQHPGKFPEDLVLKFVEYFTKENDWVLDPFAGVGSTQIACKEINRNSVGIELNEEFVKIGNETIANTAGDCSQSLIVGDSSQIISTLKNQIEDIPQFSYLITSPPYFDMLRKSRGGNDTTHKERGDSGLKQYYSDMEADIGNIDNYEEYIETVGLVLDAVYPVMKDGAYLTIIAQNMRDDDGTMRPIAWDLARRISEKYQLCQEMIWCQDNKRLGCWGYPTTYVSNVHHHYCLIFRKVCDE